MANNSKKGLAMSDIVIEPNLNKYNSLKIENVADMIKEGYSIYAIAKYMQEQGVKSKRTGKYISQTQWKKMLLSARVHGTVILHQKEYDFYAKKTKYLPQEEWIYVENALPPIVTKEYQEEVIAIIQSRERKRKKRISEMTTQKVISQMTMQPNHKKIPLSQKIYCGCCNHVYIGLPIMQEKQMN